VRINGRIVTALGTIVKADDRVEVDAAPVRISQERSYLLLNKPRGVVTTMRDPQGRRSVADLLPAGVRVVPVGRLDYATAGVLLLTDDGDLAHRLLHPRFGVDKTYRAEIAGRLSAGEIRLVQRGMVVDGFRTAGAKLRVVAARGDRSVVDLTIHEGRNRQVRRMFDALGHRVLALTRLRFGPLRLGQLPAGQIRSLTVKERLALERHRRPPDEAPRTKPNTRLKSSNRGRP
jgi:23S rRNA pseudouridine2605 synthase